MNAGDEYIIEYGEKTFAIAAPDGEAGDAVPYCSFASLEYEGRVYAAYLNGEEVEIEVEGDDAPSYLDPSQPTVQVFDVTDWPQAVPVKTTSEAVEIEGDEVDDGPLAQGGVR